MHTRTAGAHAPVPARTPLSERLSVCAAGLAWGDAGANACPPSYYRITTYAGCVRAAYIAAKSFHGNTTDTAAPSGCYWEMGNCYGEGKDGCIFLNQAPVGAGDDNNKLLCSGPPRLARSPAPHTRCAARRGCAEGTTRLRVLVVVAGYVTSM